MVRYRTVVKRRGGKVISVKTYTQSKSGKWTQAKATASPAGASAQREMRRGGGGSGAPAQEPTPAPPTVRITAKGTGRVTYATLPETSREVVEASMAQARRTTARRQVATQPTVTRAAPRRKPKKPKAIVKKAKPATFWGKVKARYREAEGMVAGVTTRPAAKALARVGITKERVAKRLTTGIGAGAAQRAFYGPSGKWKPPSFAPSKKTLKEAKEFQKGVVVGAAKGLQEKPVKTAAVGAAFYAFPKVTAYAGLGAAKVAPAAYLKAAPTLAAVGKVGSVALGTAYVAGRVTEARALPPGRPRGMFVGEKAATEVAPALIGGYKGGLAAAGVRERATVMATARTQLTPTQQKEFFKTLELAKKVKTAKVYKAPIEQVLPRKEAGITRKWLAGKGKKAIVYGSVAQKTQVTGKALKQMRPSGDIDIAVRSPQQAAVDYATAIYKATGVKPITPRAALVRGGPFGPAQEATVFVKGKAVTFHTKASLKASPFYQGKPRKTPAGVYVQRIEEQLGRKVAGAMIRGRAKDVPDYRLIAKDVATQLKKEAPFRVRKGLAQARIKGIEKIAKMPKLPSPKAPSAKAPTYAYPKVSSVYPVVPQYPRTAYAKYRAPSPTYPMPPYKAPAAPYIPPAPRVPAPPYRPPRRGRPYSPPSPRAPTPPYRPPTDYPPYVPPTRAPPYTPARPPRVPPPYRPTPRTPAGFRPRRAAKIRRRVREPIAFKQAKAYAPTLRAAVFSIKAAKKPKRLTGLEERGLLI